MTLPSFAAIFGGMRELLSKLRRNLWRYLWTGAVVSAPAAVTLLVFWIIFVKLDGILGGFFQLILGYRIPGIGFITLVFLIMLVGALTRSYLGSKLITWTDAVFTKLPIAKSVYLTVKQFQELLQIRKRIVFHKVVLLEYPRPGLWAVGFLSSVAPVQLGEKRLFPIFIPTTPNPTSGYLVFATEDQFTVLDVSFEEAMKLVISAGIIPPRDGEGDDSLRRLGS